MRSFMSMIPRDKTTTIKSNIWRRLSIDVRAEAQLPKQFSTLFGDS